MFWDLVKKMIPGLTGVDRLAAVFAAAFGTISDGRMWRSLGWIILGFVLMMIAVIWLGSILAAKNLDTGDIASVAALAA